MPYRVSTHRCTACPKLTNNTCEHCDRPLCHWHVWLQCHESCVRTQLGLPSRSPWPNAAPPGSSPSAAAAEPEATEPEATPFPQFFDHQASIDVDYDIDTPSRAFVRWLGSALLRATMRLPALR